MLVIPCKAVGSGPDGPIWAGPTFGDWSLVGVVICNWVISVGVVICYWPVPRAHQCSVRIRSSCRTSKRCNKQVSESSNTRLKPRLEGKQQSIIIIIIAINVNDTVVPTKPNQPLPLPDLLVVNSCHTHFRTWPTWNCLLQACFDVKSVTLSPAKAAGPKLVWD